MSNILQELSKKGIIQNVFPGRRVRIDPELNAPDARMSPVPLGNASFSASDEPPLAPTEVNVSTGFRVTEIIDDITSAYFGCFYVQNNTDHERDLEWEATWYHTPQLEPNQAIQTTVGENGEGGGSPQGIHPRAVQGVGVLSNDIGTPGVRRLVTPSYPTIEEINNKLIIMEYVEGNPNFYLPAVGADQDGIEVAIKNRRGIPINIISQVGTTIDLDGMPPAGPDNQFTFEHPALIGDACLVLVYRHSTLDWLPIEHWHWPYSNL